MGGGGGGGNDESLHKLQFSFLVHRRVIEIKLKRYIEWDFTHVYCILPSYDIEYSSNHFHVKFKDVYFFKYGFSRSFTMTKVW